MGCFLVNLNRFYSAALEHARLTLTHYSNKPHSILWRCYVKSLQQLLLGWEVERVWCMGFKCEKCGMHICSISSSSKRRNKIFRSKPKCPTKALFKPSCSVKSLRGFMENICEQPKKQSNSQLQASQITAFNPTS